MARNKYPCPCHSCQGAERIAKTIKLHLGAEVPHGMAFADWLAQFHLENNLMPGSWLQAPVGQSSRPRSPPIPSQDLQDPNTLDRESSESLRSEETRAQSAPGVRPDSLRHDDRAEIQPQADEDFEMGDGTRQSDTSMVDAAGIDAVPPGAFAPVATPSAAQAAESDHSSTRSIHLETLEGVDIHVPIPPRSRPTLEEEEEPDPEVLEELRQEDAERAEAMQRDEENRDHQPFTGREEADWAPSSIDAIETTRAFINEIQTATLDNGKLDEASAKSLKEPQANPGPLTAEELLHLKLYMAHLKTSQEVYNDTREAVNEYKPEAAIPDFKQMEKRVRNITGIATIADDMCPNSCLAFTGPFADLTACPMCHAERHIVTERGKRVNRKAMTTLPLGMQLAALRRDPKSCEELLHAFEETERIDKERETQEPKDYTYEDIFSGSDYQDFVQEAGLTEHDFLVGLSLDGAQLYRNKASDVWVGVWTVYNYDPKTRYRRKHILPAFIVPGPNKPKNIDSFTFRSLHHLSAIQRHNEGAGVKMWDARKGEIVDSRVFFLLQTADALAMIYMDGRVGHHGAHGCRLGCQMKGRHEKGTGFYYAVHLKPDNYTVKGCDHPDIDLRKTRFEPPSPVVYEEQVNRIATASTQKEYEKRRLETGIGKPSILSGLSPKHTMPLPNCFSIDLMHLLFLNIADLLVPLWRGVPLKKGENTKNWGDWVFLTGDVWKEHGQMVGDATRYFPSSFHRPPRNPAEKINSGYKATEYYLYLFGLGVGFFRTILPKKYYEHFCKLVKAVHIILQHTLNGEAIRTAQKLFVQFVLEFEHLYYQRRADRLHFCRPWLHTLLHLPMEATRMGPGVYITQFTMERAIGDYGREIRQPSNPFGNLAKILERQSHLNALKAMYPQLDKDKEKEEKEKEEKKKRTEDGGDGYTLLHPASKRPERVGGAAGAVMEAQAGVSRVTVWERLKLPNGQIVRSLRKESRRTKREQRITRNAKIFRNGAYQYAEIQYYFRCQPDPANQPEKWETKALVSLYTPPNPKLLEESHGTLKACRNIREDGFAVINVKEIVSLVAMIPLPTLPDEVDYKGMFFPVEKSGLEHTDS